MKLLVIIAVVCFLFLLIGPPINGDQDYFKESEHQWRLGYAAHTLQEFSAQELLELVLYVLAGFIGLLIWGLLLQSRLKQQDEFDFQNAREETEARNREMYGGDVIVTPHGLVKR